MTLQDSSIKLKNHVDQCLADIENLVVNGKKNAGPLIRKTLALIKALSHDMRKETSETVKAMPTKSRPKPVAEPVAEPEPLIEPPPAKKTPIRKIVKKTV